jgi:hypothetical protein
MSAEKPTLDDHIRWICKTSIDDGKNHLKAMLKGRGKRYSDEQLREALQAAQAHEIHTGHRKSLIVALRSALKQLTPAPSASQLSTLNPQPPPATPTEVLAPRQVILSDASKALQRLRKICATHEEKFLSATLGPRLQIGLQCLKAYQVFCIKEPGKQGQGRKPKNRVTRDTNSTGGFEGWLAAECQWLKRPTAYKYMTAIRGLSLDHTATEKQVAAALKLLLRKGPVSIKLLCDMSLDKFGPPEEIKQPEQQEFDFLRTSLSHFREETESLLKIKRQLDAYPDFKRAATSRLYSALYELTGTHWQPSDEPDALAHIDPDSITI